MWGLYITLLHQLQFFFFLLWRCDPTRVMASSFLRLLDHTRRTTVGRTPLDEWSARRRDLYPTTHNTRNGQTSMPPVGFEPTISGGERPQTYALDRAATGTGINDSIPSNRSPHLIPDTPRHFHLLWHTSHTHICGEAICTRLTDIRHSMLSRHCIVPSRRKLRPGTHYPHVTWAHVMFNACSWDVTGDLTLNSMVQIHTSVTLLMSCDLAWSSGRLTCQHASLKFLLLHTFRETWRTCRALFRRYQLFPEMEEMLTEKGRQRTFWYDTKSPDYGDQHMRANALEGIGKESKIKRKFYVSSRDARIVCPRLTRSWLRLL